MTINYTPLFILPLVGGFVFIKEWEATRYILPREDGHKLYFRSAYWGLIVSVVAFFSLTLVVYVAATISWPYSSLFTGYSDKPFDSRLVFMTLLGSPVIGYGFARFLLIPVMSGYRAEKRKVEFTTFYDDVYRRTDDNLHHLDIEHFAVILPAQRMLSARLFDPEAYDTFQDQGVETD